MIVRMPPQLKRRVSAEATTADGRGMNDVVLGILADRFDVPFTPSGRTWLGARRAAASSCAFHPS